MTAYVVGPKAGSDRTKLGPRSVAASCKACVSSSARGDLSAFSPRAARCIASTSERACSSLDRRALLAVPASQSRCAGSMLGWLLRTASERFADPSRRRDGERLSDDFDHHRGRSPQTPRCVLSRRADAGTFAGSGPRPRTILKIIKRSCSYPIARESLPAFRTRELLCNKQVLGVVARGAHLGVLRLGVTAWLSMRCEGE